MAIHSAGPGWWLASDGNWYPPELHPQYPTVASPVPAAPGAAIAMGPASQSKRLRYGGTCVSCGATIQPNEWGWHDPTIKKVSCVACPPTGHVAHQRPEQSTVPRNPVGGSSALEISNRRHDRNWQRGAVGEYLVGTYLQKELGDRVVVLNDRIVPGSRANIDHIVVAGSGVWIIDSKKRKGLIEYKNHGGLLGNDYRLTVGGRDRTNLTEQIYSYVIPVANLIGDSSIPVNPALVFVDGDWGNGATLRILTKRPYRHLGVAITWPRALIKMIDEPGPLSPDQVRALGQFLEQSLAAR